MITAIGAVYITSTAAWPRKFRSLYRSIDRHITLSARPATVSRYNITIYPAVMPLDAKYQYEFWNLYSGRSSASLRRK